MEPVLNEISVVYAPTSTTDRVSAVAATLKALDAVGLPRVLRHTRDSLDRLVERDRSLRDALVRHPRREERLFLLGRVSKAPYVEELHRAYEDADRRMIEGTFSTTACHGAVFAYLSVAPLVSLTGVEAFEASSLTIELRQMCDQENAELETQCVDVLQVATSADVARAHEALRERVIRAVASGRVLWERRADLFPRLDFGPGVERQLLEIRGTELGFNLVIDALARLDAALLSWSDGPLDPGMKFSVESHSTLSHSTFGPQRDFVCVDGAVRRFSLHLKVSGGNWRIYYIGQDGRAHVGYIGPHLATVRYAT